MAAHPISFQPKHTNGRSLVIVHVGQAHLSGQSPGLPGWRKAFWVVLVCGEH